jgi:hypothetical protein
MRRPGTEPGLARIIHGAGKRGSLLDDASHQSAEKRKRSTDNQYVQRACQSHAVLLCWVSKFNMKPMACKGNSMLQRNIQSVSRVLTTLTL